MPRGRVRRFRLRDMNQQSSNGTKAEQPFLKLIDVQHFCSTYFGKYRHPFGVLHRDTIFRFVGATRRRRTAVRCCAPAGHLSGPEARCAMSELREYLLLEDHAGILILDF